jgi:hypothetical protein
MKKLFRLLLGVALVARTTYPLAQDKDNERTANETQNESNKRLMTMRQKNIQVMLTLFDAVERHDEQ